VSDAAAPPAPRRTDLAVWLVSCLLVVSIGQAHGGYFPTAWGWCVLAFAWIACLALILSRAPAPGRHALALLAALSLLVLWIGLSVLWSSNSEQTLLEVQRALVYLLGVVAALLTVRRAAVAHLVAGLLSGIVVLAIDGLASRLFPALAVAYEEVTANRLAEPVGYYNTLGLLAVMGVLLALGFAAHGRTLPWRAVAAAPLPLLATTAYFTFSRGAVVALAAGLVAAIAFDRRRLALVTTSLLVALPCAVAVWLASRSTALTGSGAGGGAALAREGTTLAIALLALTAGAAAIVLAYGALRSRIRFSRPPRRAYGGALVCVALALVACAGVRLGDPVSLASTAGHRLAGGQSQATPVPADLNRRLASGGSGGRFETWRVARHEHQEHRWLGSGAGTFEQFWLRERTVNLPARDAHSLYLEALAELGWPGLLLVIAVLAVPLAGAVRARADPLAAAAVGAYAAYLVHAGIDWDWEMPIVTLVALACGAALVLAQRERQRPRRPIGVAWRAGAVAITLSLAAVAMTGLVANRNLTAATSAIDAGAFAAGERHARTALSWAPWSAEARHQLGRAQVGLRRTVRGRASLAEAVRRNPRNWQAWYDLGLASDGGHRRRAFARAARLNPLGADIAALRAAGYMLPGARGPL
jgi:hypothetical protein